MYFHMAKYEIGEYVGLQWQPTSEIDFYVRDIRKIEELKSGKKWLEYEVVRRDYQDDSIIHSTGWHTGDKLFRVDQSLAIINRNKS